MLLSYSDAHITDSVARLHPYFPFLAVTVVAKITLFCPRQGHHLGEIRKHWFAIN